MKIVHLTSEIAPFSKTGGLADVLAALPQALCTYKEISSVTVITPLYGFIQPETYSLTKLVKSFYVEIGSHFFLVQAWKGFIQSQVPIYFIDHPIFSQRFGIYGPENQPEQAYADNALRFALFSKAALCLLNELALEVDILHCHDWQTGLALYDATQKPFQKKPCRKIFTIHNLAFRGLFPLEQVAALGIPSQDLTPEGLEFYGQASFLKAGLLCADQITTVSPAYSQEIQTPEFGFGFDALFQKRASQLSGILNGIDDSLWNPACDPYLSTENRESSHKIQTKDLILAKEKWKKQLQQAFGIPIRPNDPLCATISRLTYQKGIDLICDSLESSFGFSQNLQYIVLGQGESALQNRLLSLAARHPHRMAVQIGYDEKLAHLITAGADIYIMPSRFEPCGLNQMYSLAYGTIPVVRSTGGLFNTVKPYDPVKQTGTGFSFAAADVPSLTHSWNQALSTYHQDKKAFRNLIQRAIQEDFSWQKQAKEYIKIYQQT